MKQTAEKFRETAAAEESCIHIVGGQTSDPVCADAPYPRYKPGRYDVRCVSARIYQPPQFRGCWKWLLEFQFLDSRDKVFGFLNLGMGPPDGPLPPKRGGRYFKTWCVAQGEAPRKGRKMPARVFVGKIFAVLIGDTDKTMDGDQHPPEMLYSTVKAVLKRIWP